MKNIRDIEKQLAYEAARSDIECLAKNVTRGEGGWWFHLKSRAIGAEDQKIIDTAERYLESRHLLRRRIDNPYIVQIIDAEASE